MRLITPKKKGLISRRSLVVGAPAVLLTRKLGAQGCGGGFCYPPQAPASTCAAKSFRDWSKLSTPVTIINPESISIDVANCFEVRAENKIGATYFAFTENYNAPPPQHSGSIALWTSTSLSGPWAHQGDAITFSSGAWDDNQLYCPSCIEIPYGSGNWYLFYCASNTSNVFSVGYASTTTPLTPGSWTKYASNPIITGGGGGIADPFVLPSPTGSGYIMYVASNYPGAGPLLCYTSATGLSGWTYSNQFLPTAVMGDPDYGVHSIFEPTVWYNKACFYELLFDYGDFHNVIGVGGGSIGYANSAGTDGFNFARYEGGPIPPILFGGGNTRVVQENGLIYLFTDNFPDLANDTIGGVGLCTMPDVFA